MIGIVVVSHSRRLAEAAVELALQMAPATSPPIEVAAGLDDDVLGTDAARVKEAIDRAASADGVLVLMDLGSAVISAETAIELRGRAGNGPVVLSDAPLVEGLVAAVALAAAGAPLSEVAAEASRAAHAKSALAGGAPGGSSPVAHPAGVPTATSEFVVSNEHGLHARPAARFVTTARRFDADVTVRNLSTPGPVVSGRSVSALSTLGVLAGQRVEVTASGAQAGELVDAIATLISSNFDEPVTAAAISLSRRGNEGPVGAAPGIGIGPKVSMLGRTEMVPAGTGISEPERLSAAIALARSELTTTRERVARVAGETEATIFDAHLLLLDDEELAGRARGLIEDQEIPAADAWQATINEVAARFSALSDPYMQARVQDVRAVGDQVLARLTGAPAVQSDSGAGVVVADDLTPGQMASLDAGRVVGVVTSSGSPVSHASILARSMGIPTVVGVGDDILRVPDGTTIVVDGSAGRVVVGPAPALAEEYRQKAAIERRATAGLIDRAREPAITTDGVHVGVCANVGSRGDALDAVRYGADGVGLLRTEILFLDRAEAPTEAEQTAAYFSIAQSLEGRRLTIRTLDVGGDKPLSYFSQRPEPNPFLGRRGLRLSLCYPEVFKTQLRAIVRTAQRYLVTVLFPMVTTVDELRSARSLLSQAARDVGCDTGILPMGMEVGAMAEVPAFALRARAMVPMLDVISIGSNDMTQYAVAADRGNADVASLADALDPAVLRLIADVAQAAGRRCRVTVCGEMANDPKTAVLLVGLGVRELSMTSRAIPEVKQAVRAASAGAAVDLAELALQRPSAAGVRELLADLC